MAKKINKLCRKVSAHAKRGLMRTSLEEWIRCGTTRLVGLFEPNEADFLKISFEAASALATAGLSSGILADITLGSKIILILLMYIGRVGVITFGNALLAGKSGTIKSCKDMAV